MICSEKSAVTYKLYGITQFFERTLEDNRILQFLALVQGESNEQCVIYGDLKFNEVYSLWCKNNEFRPSDSHAGSYQYTWNCASRSFY